MLFLVINVEFFVVLYLFAALDEDFTVQSVVDSFIC